MKIKSILIANRGEIALRLQPGDFIVNQIHYHYDHSAPPDASVIVLDTYSPDELAALEQNFYAVLDEINRAKPASAKGRYIKKVTASATFMNSSGFSETARPGTVTRDRFDYNTAIAAIEKAQARATSADDWFQILEAERAWLDKSLYTFCFFTLTGVHALHVLGGFVPLGIVLHRAKRREYSSSRHEGVRFCVQYWHFLAVVWLVLVAVLVTTT